MNNKKIMKTLNLNDQQLKNLLGFLNRVTLQANEINAFLELVNLIKAQLNVKEVLKEKKEEDKK